MKIKKVSVCPHCSHEWEPRIDDPKRCPTCGKSLPDKLEEKEIIVQRVMICPKCGHEWEPRKRKPKQCPKCKQYLDSDDRFNKHVSRSRGQRLRYPVVTESGETIVFSEDLPKVSNFVCPLCYAKYYMELGLHGGNRKVKCGKCSTIFFTSNMLETNLRNYTIMKDPRGEEIYMKLFDVRKTPQIYELWERWEEKLGITTSSMSSSEKEIAQDDYDEWIKRESKKSDKVLDDIFLGHEDENEKNKEE